MATRGRFTLDWWQLPARPASATAVHEAAHATVGEATGIEIKTVSIVADNATAGRALLNPTPAGLGFEHDHLIRLATLFAAGAAAEAYFGYVPAAQKTEPGCDDEKIFRIARVVTVASDAETAAFETWVRARAAAIVAELAPEIAAVAIALDEKKTLDRRELLSLVPALMNTTVALRTFAMPQGKRPHRSALRSVSNRKAA